MTTRAIGVGEILILAVLGLDLLLGIVAGAVRAREPEPVPIITSSEFIEQEPTYGPASLQSR
jgi:hypothetical protein